MNISLHTLGCKLNFAETASFGRQFAEQGHRIVGTDEQADVVVINTCSVTEHADRECRQIVRRALRRSPEAFVAVVGCYAQLQSETLAAIEGVDIVLGTQEKFDLLTYIGTGSKKPMPSVHVACIDEANIPRAASSVGYEDRTRAFLKVQDGCDYSCSFCTIPLARGASRSLQMDDVCAEAVRAAALGYREIVLTGVNVGDYGTSTAHDLVVLVRELVKIDGLVRIRISSIEPNLLTDELLDLWANDPKLCHHWHIPLQSGSDAILRAMRRRYLTDLYRERIDAIKSRIPNAGIGADVIVGFPGETDELFEETYSFLRDLSVTYLHVFSYSERPNTAAKEMRDQIPPSAKAQRSERLRGLGLRKKHLFYESFIGATTEVLFEERSADGTIYGWTGEYVRVGVNDDAVQPNDIKRVLVTGANSESCEGTIQ
jgi:threonylcarbamoyladenosine tRNA methylthiotransferase MtaB